MRTIFAATIIPAFLLLVVSCSGNGKTFAYTGRMDVDTITISSQASGQIDSLSVSEGDTVRKAEVLGKINTDRLEAQKKQQLARLDEFDVRRGSAQAQINQAQAQLKLAEETLRKTEKVLAQGGATRQQRDELSTKVEVDQANLAVLQSNYKLIAAQEQELRAGVDVTDIAIRDATVVSPVSGTVLDKFHFAGELATTGTPLLEVADLSQLTVEIYVPLDKLGSITIGGKAEITAEGVKKSLAGKIYWISSQAEFTPKTILTRETRTTLVYGVKIHVPNTDGALKIGMPVDVRL
jgi:HlyD family secretion protein